LQGRTVAVAFPGLLGLPLSAPAWIKNEDTISLAAGTSDAP
jgi:hypothetical protein